MRQQRGVAMIVVMVMVLIFLSLVITVVLLATTAIRRANTFRDRLIAFQIADAGIQDALYWMNYGGYPSKQYPCTGPTGVYDASYRYFRGSDYTGPDSTWTNTDPNTFTYNPTPEISGGKCMLYFEDNTETNLDRIVSTGYYRGRTATVTINIRGQNGNGNNLHNTTGRWLCDWDGFNWGNSTWGTAEAFNKHEIFAYQTSGINAEIKGNVARTIVTNIESSVDMYSVTQVSASSFTSDFTLPDTSGIGLPTAPGTLPADYDDIYSETGILYNSTYPGGVAVNSINDGVYWDNALKTYRFGVANDGTTPQTYTGTNNTVWLRSYGSVTYPKALLRGATIGNYFRCDGSTNIDSAIFINPANTAIDISNYSAAVFAINANARISGDLAVKYPTIGSQQGLGTNSWILNGTILVNRAFTFAGSNVTINATSGTRPAAIMVNTSVWANPLVLPSSGSAPTITLGPNQNSAIIFYGIGVTNAEVRFGASFIPNYYSKDQAAVIAYSEGSNALILFPNSGAYNVRGLLYAHGNSSNGNVNLSNTTGEILGSIVCNGTVTFGNAYVHYDGTAFKKTASVQKGFKGGRRVYLPVPGSWSFK